MQLLEIPATQMRLINYTVVIEGLKALTKASAYNNAQEDDES